MELLTPTAFFALSLGLILSMVAVARPIFGFMLLILAAVGIDYATTNLTMMAGADAIILVMLLLSVLREKGKTFPGERVRVPTPADSHFVWLGLLGVIYTIVGFARGNDTVFLLGDAFHVILEMSLPFFLCTIFLRRQEAQERFLRVMMVTMLVLAAAILFLYVTGLIRHLPGAGDFYRHSSVWRLRVNAHFPLYPLVWLIGVWFYQHAESGRRLNGFAILALTLVLILTLKRTLWVGFVGILVFYFAALGTRQKLNSIRAIVVGVGVAFLVGGVLLPAQFANPMEELQAYTHSIEKRFSSRESDIDVSVRNRIVQLGDALEVIGQNPLGYGLGNEARVRFLADGPREPIHYVHNAFIHYTLLMGVFYPILMLFLSLLVLRRGLRTYRALPDGLLKGGVLGAIGAYVAVLVASLTEIGTNTFFLPFSVAYILLAERYVPARRPAAAPDVAGPGRLDPV